MYAMVWFHTIGLKLHLVTQFEENCVIRKKKLLNRVLKWWRHTNEISEITGFVQTFWKNNVWCQPFILRKLHTNPSNIFFFWTTQKNLEGFVWSFLSITGLWSHRQFAPKSSFLASRPLGHCSFRISRQIP